MMQFRRSRILLFFLLAALAGNLAHVAELSTACIGFGSIEGAICQSLDQSSPTLAAAPSAAEQKQLDTIYSSRNYKPLWITNSNAYSNQASTASQQTLAMLSILRNAEQYGLDPIIYRSADIEAALAVSLNQSTLAPLDVSISLAVLRFVTHVHFGRIHPTRAGFDTPRRDDQFDIGAVVATLATTANTAAVIESIEPAFVHYAALKRALAQYRELAKQSLAPLPPLKSKSIKPGELYDGIEPLRQLLTALGDLSQDNTESSPILDTHLADALKRFQFRHGLEQDGALGTKTYAALTTPLSQRVRQIELTLERWRWLPTTTGPMIFVNIPQYRLFAFPTNDDRESQMLSMDVIVGNTYRETRTPVFSANMTYLQFRPYWNVPRKIARDELLPKIRADQTYLEKEALELVDSESDQAAILPATTENLDRLTEGTLRLRQQPGPSNSLGLIKFGIPNKYDVYLHSTPSPALFRASRRTFSHGCIRVSDPTVLAEWVLHNEDNTWSRDEIEAAMNSNSSRRVELKQNVSVLILYGTAIANEAGRVYFLDDVYEEDARLEKLLRKQQSLNIH